MCFFYSLSFVALQKQGIQLFPVLVNTMQMISIAFNTQMKYKKFTLIMKLNKFLIPHTFNFQIQLVTISLAHEAKRKQMVYANTIQNLMLT